MDDKQTIDRLSAQVAALASELRSEYCGRDDCSAATVPGECAKRAAEGLQPCKALHGAADWHNPVDTYRIERLEESEDRLSAQNAQMREALEAAGKAIAACWGCDGQNKETLTRIRAALSIGHVNACSICKKNSSCTDPFKGFVTMCSMQE